MSYFDALTPGSMTIILVGVTMLGGAIGSFLNVVIYRLPAGMSLIHPPSRCPRCEHPIRAYDNIPILGWILLRGKCRDCGEPISSRYPMIEAIVALTFLAVVWLEVVRNPISADWPIYMLIAGVALHLLLLTTLLAAGMIEWDGSRAPRSIWLPLILTSFLLWGFIPAFTVWPVWFLGYPPTSMLGIIDGLFGTAAGFAIGIILSWIDHLGTEKSESQPLWLATLCIGLVLGWQVVAITGAVYLPILLIEILLHRAGIIKKVLPHGLALFILTLANIVVIATTISF